MPEKMLKQEELVNFRGGSGTVFCLLTLTKSSGQTVLTSGTGDYTNTSADSDLANAECVDLVLNNPLVAECSYDCSWDGIGQ